METKNCELCGNTFTPKKQWAEDDPYRRGRFCSRRCKELNARADGRNSLSCRKWQLKQKYGITWDQYHELFEAQGGACAICGTTEPIGREASFQPAWLAVDHDHVTRAVRGLLCVNCNTGIGSLGDSVERLRAAIAYLSRHE